MRLLLRTIGMLACAAAVTAFLIWVFPPVRMFSPQNVDISADVSAAPTVSLMLSGPGGEQELITAEVANDDAARARGLMHRTELARGRGMFFAFEAEAPLAFWMKNTLIPLDILYFDQSGRLVSAASMIPCQADPCPTYPSAAPAQFALEIPAGEIERLGVTQGWRIDGADAPLW